MRTAVLSRRSFCTRLTAGCAGASLLGACSQTGVDDEADANGSTSSLWPAPRDGVLVLPFADYPALLVPGGWMAGLPYGFGDFVVVVHTGANRGAEDYVAISGQCTHQRCRLDYNDAAVRLDCRCHASQFSLDGAVLRGPATIPVPTYDLVVTETEILVALGAS